MVQTITEATEITSDVDRRHNKAAALLEKWLREEDGYDDRIWPLLEQELKDKDSALRCRNADELGT